MLFVLPETKAPRISSSDPKTQLDTMGCTFHKNPSPARAHFENARRQNSSSYSLTTKNGSSSTRANRIGTVTSSAHFSFHTGSQMSLNRLTSATGVGTLRWALCYRISAATVLGLNMILSLISRGNMEYSVVALSVFVRWPRIDGVCVSPIPLAIRLPRGQRGFVFLACSATAIIPPITPRL